MPVVTSIDLDPMHLSIFTLNRLTGAPVAHVPVYAEVVWTKREPLPPPDNRFRDLIGRALSIADLRCGDSAACRDRVTTALITALTTVWPQSLRDELAVDIQRAIDFLAGVIRLTLEAEGVATLDNLSEERLAAALERALRQQAEREQLNVEPASDPAKMLATYPLGVLASDHVGYLSFDLKRLPVQVLKSVINAMKALRANPNAVAEATVWVYPVSANFERFDALSQGRFASDAILAKINISDEEVPSTLKNLGIPAMQRPDLTDWRLSPASFSTNQSALVGDDGCETLLPANVALQEFYFYQVVRLNDVQTGIGPELDDMVKAGIVHEYRLAWYPLGHSLGQILYSLALAPGESVNLAVIDWTRRDEAQRREQTKLDEQLVHDEHRDRTITETVSAAIKEYQHGSSFMAGLAGSAGVSAAISAGLGIAAGLSGSLGGGSSDSIGSRDIAATTVQKLSDNITQASSAMRELQSTVVVHSVQAEKEAIETRTVVNYNHSHALTILYYEVLRHFRVATEFVRRRPALLIKMSTHGFTAADIGFILQNRVVLEAALLDRRMAEGFNALERIAHRARIAAASPPPLLPPPPPLGEGKRRFRYFMFIMTTGGEFNDDVDIRATLLGNVPIHLLNRAGPTETDVLDYSGLFDQPNVDNTFVAMLPQSVPTVEWDSINAVSIHVAPGGGDEGKVSFQRIQIIAFDDGGGNTILLDKKYEFGHLRITEASFVLLPLNFPPPPPAPPPPPPPRPPEEIEDEAKQAELLAHLSFYSAHYNRALLLNQNSAERARHLDSIKFPGGSTVLDRVENRPLEVVGDYLAYPCMDPALEEEIQRRFSLIAPDPPPPSERLVTLPNRGVFAEAKLGHCNSSETIDNTRFWDWQQSPIPHFAPEIAAAQPVTPRPDQPNLAPTPFPSALVNIVNPPAAPDPTGLTSALNVLATPNIFRDMSARAEVADLLKKLSDNSISIAQASNQARQIQAKYGDGGSAVTGGISGAGGIGGPRALPTQSSSVNRDLHDLQPVLKNAVQDGLVTPEAAQEIYEAAARGAFTPELVANRPASNPPTMIRQEFLNSIATVNFTNGQDINNWFLMQTGQEFIDWFNARHANKDYWAKHSIHGNDPFVRARSVSLDVVKQRFVAFWDRIPLIYAPAGQISLVQFVALMSIGINERAGNLVSVPEFGNLKYMYEPVVDETVPDHPVIKKQPYNAGPNNRTAFLLFRDAAFIQAHGTKPMGAQLANTTDERWKSTTYPADVSASDDPSITGFIQEADFFKFRGRGVIQTTWRSNYIRLIRFVQSYTGPNTTIQSFNARWAGHDVNDVATRSSNLDWDTLFAETDFVAHAIAVHSDSSGGYLTFNLNAAELNGSGPGSIRNMGAKIGGNGYRELFYKRVVQILNSLGNDPSAVTSPATSGGGTHI